MLVLSRRAGEDVVFPELGITVKVHRVSGNRVTIGIEAPPEVRVLRGELEFDSGSSGQAVDLHSIFGNRQSRSLTGVASPAK